MHNGYVNCVRFSPDGKTFVTVSSDKKINLYDSETAELKHSIEKAHSMGILRCAFLPDGQLVTASSDQTLKIWNKDDLTLLKTLQTSEEKDLSNM